MIDCLESKAGGWNERIDFRFLNPKRNALCARPAEKRSQKVYRQKQEGAIVPLGGKSGPMATPVFEMKVEPLSDRNCTAGFDTQR